MRGEVRAHVRAEGVGDVRPAVGPAVRTRAVFANNMIYDIHNLGTGAAGRAVDGIIYNPTGLPNSANGNGSTVGWFDNTWHLDMAAGEGVGNTGFLFDANFAGSNTTVGQSDSIAFYNNIASIKRADTAATRMWLLFGEGAAGNLALLSNNNAYYYVNSPAGIPFAQIPSPWPGGTTRQNPGRFQELTLLKSRKKLVRSRCHQWNPTPWRLQVAAMGQASVL